MQRAKILIADDESKILKFLTGFFSREGFEVFGVSSGYELLSQFEKYNPDLVILDIMMPGLDGFEVCRKIREKSYVPIIFLSAKNEISDKIIGLSLGSDDYLTKPFDSAELLLRVRAILRRTREQREGETGNGCLKAPGLEINKSSRRVTVNDQEIDLTPKEFELLWLLINHPDQVFTRDQLLYQIWDTDYCADSGIVTTLVKRLREKIEDDSANPRYIKTIRGVGYKFGVKPCS